MSRFENMDRLEHNLKIINILKTEAHKHPYLRFWQLLTCLGIVRYEDGVSSPIVKDGFYEESSETLERVKNAVSVREK